MLRWLRDWDRVAPDRLAAVKLCTVIGHRFDKRNLTGWVDENALPSGGTRRTPYVRCSRCDTPVQTTVLVARSPLRFPLDS